jgi:hypothetical protein
MVVIMEDISLLDRTPMAVVGTVNEYGVMFDAETVKSIAHLHPYTFEFDRDNLPAVGSSINVTVRRVEMES